MSSNILIDKNIKEITTIINDIQNEQKRFYLLEEKDMGALLNLMNNKLNKIEDNFYLIDQELNRCENSVRNEYKSIINNIKLEYNKNKSTIKDLKNKYTLYIENNKYNPENYLKGTSNEELKERFIKNTDNLIQNTHIANEVLERDKNTAEELKRQGDVLLSVHLKLGQTEENLTLIQQIRQVMQNNELFYRFKLYAVMILLLFANLLIIFIKFC